MRTQARDSPNAERVDLGYGTETRGDSITCRLKPFAPLRLSVLCFLCKTFWPYTGNADRLSVNYTQFKLLVEIIYHRID